MVLACRPLLPCPIRREIPVTFMFENLDVCQKAVEFADEDASLTEDFPGGAPAPGRARPILSLAFFPFPRAGTMPWQTNYHALHEPMHAA
jgi:hypothetical protein